VCNLEQRLESHDISFAPAEELRQNDLPGFPEAHSNSESLITAPPISNQLLRIYGLNSSPLTPPESALSNSHEATPWSHLDLPKIVLSSEASNASAGVVYPITPENSASTTSASVGISFQERDEYSNIEGEETGATLAQFPPPAPNEQASSGQQGSLLQSKYSEQ
jgi:hypothetical protein